MYISAYKVFEKQLGACVHLYVLFEHRLPVG